MVDYTNLTNREPVSGPGNGDAPNGFKVERDAAGLSIRYQKVPPITSAMIAFTVIWIVFTIGGIYGSQLAKHTFRLEDSLFGIPFLVAAVGLVCYVVFLLRGHWEIRMQAGQGKLFVGVGHWGWRRSFTYNRETRIGIRPMMTSRTGKAVCAIGLDTPGQKRFSFGAGLEPQALDYFSRAIAQEIARG